MSLGEDEPGSEARGSVAADHGFANSQPPGSLADGKRRARRLTYVPLAAMDLVDRRQFLGRSAIALGAATIAGLGWPEFLREARAAAPGLGSERARTYGSLVAALDRVPGTQVDASRTDEALRTFRGWYGRQRPEVQQHADVVLDMIERGPSGAGFSDLSPDAARALLRSWLTERTKLEREFEAKVEDDGRDYPYKQGSKEDFEAFLREEARRINENRAAIRGREGRDALELDDETGLQRYQPPPDPDGPRGAWPEADLATPESRRRYLATVGLAFGSMPFYEDGESAPP